MREIEREKEIERERKETQAITLLGNVSKLSAFCLSLFLLLWSFLTFVVQ